MKKKSVEVYLALEIREVVMTEGKYHNSKTDSYHPSFMSLE